MKQTHLHPTEGKEGGEEGEGEEEVVSLKNKIRCVFMSISLRTFAILALIDETEELTINYMKISSTC